MTNIVRVMIERGPKGKKVVAAALDWPGWSRGARTEDAALELLESYRGRYQPDAKLAGLELEFDSAGELDVVERIEGSGSTDFWGISFSSGTTEQESMSEPECERKIDLLQASWIFSTRCRIACRRSFGKVHEEEAVTGTRSFRTPTEPSAISRRRSAW